MVAVFWGGSVIDCGGCEGLGSHRRTCPTQPGWNWARLYMIADDLGDSIGSNDHEAANMAYAIAGRMKKRWMEAGRIARP